MSKYMENDKKVNVLSSWIMVIFRAVAIAMLIVAMM
jgi:hypothetical protein